MFKPKPRHLSIFFITVFVIQMILLVVLLLLPSESQAIEFKPQVGIPVDTGETYDFKGDTITIDESSIGIYIKAIYKYAVGIVGILAAVVLMFGGVVWLTAGGNQTRIGEAKAWIGASLTGLIIVLTSYMILYTVNPDLVNFRPIVITPVEGIGCCDKPKSGEGNACQMLGEADCESGHWYKEGWSCNDAKTLCTNLPSEGPAGTVYKWICLKNKPCEDGTDPPSITYERSTCKEKIGPPLDCFPKTNYCCGLVQ